MSGEAEIKKRAKRREDMFFRRLFGMLGMDVMNKFARWFEGFVIVGLSAAIGWSSGAVLPDWLDPVPEAELRYANRSTAADGREHAADKSEVAKTDRRQPTGANGAAGSAASSGRWIPAPRHGPYRAGATRVAGVRGDGSVRAEAVDPKTARKGFGDTLRKALRKRGKAPKEERDARLTDDPFSTDEHQKKECAVYPDDIFLTGIPMINQGPLAYCAVASAARVLQGYGIEVTMEDMAVLANSSPTGGTNLPNWEQALRQVADEHGLELKVIPELTESKTPLVQLVNGYNELAVDMGYSELALGDYVYSVGPRTIVSDYSAFDHDREYPVQREVMLSSDLKRETFDANVTARIDESDPLFWSVTLGDVAEQTAYGEGTYLKDGRGTHMRLIIGYNEDRGGVLYSDSWGEGHELKRMDAADALSITRGMYYLAD